VQDEDSVAEAARLEELWRGDFGNQYVERNASAGAERDAFWREQFERFPAERVLEVGCNVGANLRHIARLVDPKHVWGVDINETSLALLDQQLPEVNSGWAQARDLPFRDGWFDLVFTVAVLIHQPEDTIDHVVRELTRCSSRYVCAIEYTADEVVEIDYRGARSAFFKRPYRDVILAAAPDLELVHESELTRADGFDDGLGYFVFQKR
jgi:pseudaminic acid biosynthesis-associated methylase